jgi:hypothetical protein
MLVIHVQVGKNFIKDVLLDGGFGVNIIMEKMRVWLGMSKSKPAPYNLHVVYQTIAKPLCLIKDLKILVHGIPYAMTFIVIQNSVLNSNYSMLLGCPWLRDAKVPHNWGNNIITIQGTNTIISILVTKKLGAITKRPKVLVCYDFHSRIFDKEEDLMFTTKPRLFSIRTIVVLTLVWSYQPIKLIT